MAIKTQMRLAQLTGSLDDTGSEASSLSATSLQDVLDAVASGVKRITGGSNFHSAKAGSFTHSLMEITGSKLAFDSTSANATVVTNHASNALKLQSQADNGIHLESATLTNAGLKIKPVSGGNTTLSVLENNKDLIFGTFNAGNPLEVFRIDGDANSNAGSLLMSGGKQIQFGDSTASISRGASAGEIVMNAASSHSLKVGGDAVLAVGSAVTASAAIVPSSNLGQSIGSSTLKFGNGYFGQINAIGVTGSIAGTGITNDQVAISNNGTLEGDSNFTWNGTVLTLGGQSQGTTQLSVSGDAVITGDLTINGTTTTVNTTNLEVTDAVILLASGAAGGSPTKDMGIIMERQGGNIGFYWEETGDLMKLGFTNDYADDNALAASAGALTFQVDKLQLTGSGYEITAEDLGGGTVDLVLTSAKNLGLFTNDAGSNNVINFGSFQTQTDTTALALDLSTDYEATFKDGAGGKILTIHSTGGGYAEFASDAVVSGSQALWFEEKGGAGVKLHTDNTDQGILYLTGSALSLNHSNGSDSSELRIWKASAYVGFDTSATTNVTYTWPNAPGSNGYVLQANTDGTLSWAAQGGAANAKKVAQTIAATVSAGTAASSDGGFSVVDTQAITAVTAPNALDVFVNGQLLVSSSIAYASLGSASAGDYAISNAGVNNTDLKFTFDLEADDVVTVIVRA